MGDFMNEEEGLAALDEIEELEVRAKDARDALVQRQTELRSDRDSIEGELARIEAKLSRLNDFLSPYESEQEGADDSTKRKTGVLATTREMVETLPAREDGWTEDDIVETVLRRDPSIKDNSVRSALRRLHKKGVIKRWGKRGDRRYAVVVIESADGSRGQAYGIIANAGNEGVTWSDVAWNLGDADVTQAALHALMESDHIEKLKKDGVVYYRISSSTMRSGIEGIQRGMERSAKKGTEEEEATSVPQEQFAFPGVRPPEE